MWFGTVLPRTVQEKDQRKEVNTHFSGEKIKCNVHPPAMDKTSAFGKKTFPQTWHIKLPCNAHYCILVNKKNTRIYIINPLPLFKIISFITFPIVIAGDAAASWLGGLRQCYSKCVHKHECQPPLGAY